MKKHKKTLVRHGCHRIKNSGEINKEFTVTKKK